MTGDINKALDDLIALAKEVGKPAFELLTQSVYNRAVVALIGEGVASLAFALVACWLWRRRYNEELFAEEITVGVIALGGLGLLFAAFALSEIPALMCPACEAARSLVK